MGFPASQCSEQKCPYFNGLLVTGSAGNVAALTLSPGSLCEVRDQVRLSSRETSSLDQLQPLQAGMPVLADDDVIVDGDAERSGDIDDRPGHLDIRQRRRRIAGGMIVHQDDSRGR